MAYLDDPRGQFQFAVDLVQWHSPASDGHAYDSANHLGIYRMALLTDDIDAAYDGLRALASRACHRPRPSRWARASPSSARCSSPTPTAPCSSSSSLQPLLRSHSATSAHSARFIRSAAPHGGQPYRSQPLAALTGARNWRSAFAM